VHAYQSPATLLPRPWCFLQLLGVKTNTIVANDCVDSACIFSEHDAHFMCMGMSGDVGQRFLYNAVECRLHISWEALFKGCCLQIDIDSKFLLILFDIPAQCRQKSQIVEGARAQIYAQVADSAQRLMGQSACYSTLRESPG
jgi:hypothetical protein